MHLPRAISLLLLALTTAACVTDEAPTSTTSTGDTGTSTDAPTSTTPLVTTGDTTSDATTGDATTVDTTDPTAPPTTGDTTTGDPALHAACEAALAGERGVTSWLCRCTPEGELGDDCRARDPAADTCACDLLASDPVHADALTCNAAAAALLDDCIADAPCGLDGVQSCLDPYWEAQTRCPALPRSSAVELQCRGAGVFTCDSGERLPDTWKCDGFEDCPDLSDEAACGFVCGDGQTIPFDWQCDGEPDCRDASDEQRCN